MRLKEKQRLIYTSTGIRPNDCSVGMAFVPVAIGIRTHATLTTGVVLYW
jgi:hypothetical protein